MTRFFGLIIPALLCLAPCPAQTGNSVSMTSNGWTLTANSGRAVLTIRVDKLGTVLADVRLGLKSGKGLRPLKRWTVEKKGPNQLAIQTQEPRTNWLFDLYPQYLKISSTTTEGFLSGEAPAPPERIVARLLDPEGIPAISSSTARNG